MLHTYLKSLDVISTLMTFAEATVSECINVRHCQRTHATYTSAKTDNPCSSFSLRELSYLLIISVIKSFLDVDGKWPPDLERLNSLVMNGAISSVTCFMTETGSGSAAELLSGKRNMADMTSSTLTKAKIHQRHERKWVRSWHEA